MGDGKPKYLNSPETPVFDKSRNLYGLNFARTARTNNIILCEGYMDVISMHQAGFTQAVASLGTAFTAGQANILRMYISCFQCIAHHQLAQILISDQILVRNRLNVIIPFHILRKPTELLRNFTVELRFGFRILQVIVSLQDTQFEEKAVLRLVNPLLELLGSLVLNEFVRILIGRSRRSFF